MNIDHPYILDIFVSNHGKIVNICWIPSHIGIRGNDEADTAAKSALEFEFEIVLKFKIPSTDLKSFHTTTCIYKFSLADILVIL